jgi:hypothetical protein
MADTYGQEGHERGGGESNFHSCTMRHAVAAAMTILMTVRTKLSSCLRKQRFASEEEAQAAATQATLTLHPYCCDRCRQFHLTSRTKGRRVPRPA